MLAHCTRPCFGTTALNSHMLSLSPALATDICTVTISGNYLSRKGAPLRGKAIPDDLRFCRCWGGALASALFVLGGAIAFCVWIAVIASCVLAGSGHLIGQWRCLQANLRPELLDPLYSGGSIFRMVSVYGP